MKPLVSQLWPQFMADPDFAACFGQVIVEHARMLRQDRQVEFTLRSAAPLDQNLCARLLASLQPDYEGFELKIKNLFGYAMLDEHALRILLEDMKRDGVPINGFLDRSSITITGQNITVGVCHGTKFLQEMGFEELLAKRVAEHTGVTPKVTLQSAVTAAEQQQMEEKLERKIAPPVVKFEKKNTAPSIKVEGLNLTDKPVTIFHGKMFTPKNLTPLKDLGGEGGKCMIWGDVFFTEVKGNYRKIYTVSITDYTGSINLKVRAQEGEDCSKWEGIGKGSTVIVRGDCSYDKYEHDYIVYPYDVLIVERKKREDTAPEKRVELHLHTKLSSMDGFCDPGGIIKLAHILDQVTDPDPRRDHQHDRYTEQCQFPRQCARRPPQTGEQRRGGKGRAGRRDQDLKCRSGGDGQQIFFQKNGAEHDEKIAAEIRQLVRDRRSRVTGQQRDRR